MVVDSGEIDITLKCYNIYKKQKRKKEVKMMPAISSTHQVLSVLSRFFPGSFSTFQVLSVLSRFFQYFPGFFSTFQVIRVAREKVLEQRQNGLGE